MKKSVLIFSFTVLFFSEINFTQNKTVVIDQRNSNNQQVGILRKWEGYNFTNPPFNPGTQFNFSINSNQVILGDQTVISNQKYNNWNNDKSDVKNHHSFQITEFTNDLTSRFEPTHSGITIKTSLEGTNATGGVIEFRDPWFIDYPDGQYGSQLRNRGMTDAVPRQRTSPFYPDATTQYEYGQKYNGVFLDREISPNNTYYKVSVPEEQTIEVHGQNRKFYPYYWTGSGVNYQNENDRETGVVFTQGNATATAVLKGELMSNDQNGISNNSQCKLIYTNGNHYLVYESMNNVWLTIYNSSGSGELLIKTNAKNPSIDYLGNIITIICEYWEYELENLGLYFVQINTLNNSIVYEYGFNISNNYNDFGIIKPVVSCNHNQEFIIYKPTISSNLKYRLRTGGYWSIENDLPFTDGNTLNWSVASNKDVDYHIAFQQGTSSIYYMHADAKTGLRFCNLKNISAGSGFTTNKYPTISSQDGNKYYKNVSWQGYYESTLEKKLNKESDVSLNRFSAVMRIGYYDSTGWCAFNSFGEHVNYPNNASLNAATGSILVYSEENGLYSKYVKRYSDGNYSSIQYLSNTGIQPLVSNGPNFNNVKAVVFNTNTPAPYLILPCSNDFYSEDLVKKTDSSTNHIRYGRSCVIVKNGIEFLFNLGNITVDGNSIKFINIHDTVKIKSQDDLNSSVRSKPFFLNNLSDFYFSNYFYTINSKHADSVLSQNFKVKFRCELVKHPSNKVVGTFDEIIFTKHNTRNKVHNNYKINCNRIEPGNYYLRLNTDVNENAEFNIIHIQTDGVDLHKNNIRYVEFSGLALPNEFKLEQNYPNPFNPTTTISYQLPKAGLVTLKVYDILGNEVAVLVNELKEQGRYTVQFDVYNLPSGVYFCTLKTNDFSKTNKMILIK
jgi:hypothetical protein